MKKTINVLIFLMLAVSGLYAQEFSLHVRCYISDTLYSHPVIFGYDTAATDGYDGTKWFGNEIPGGEQEWPSPGLGQDVDFQMGGQALNRVYYSPIDIRHKPSGNRFSLQYEIDLLCAGSKSARLEWDKSLIPPIIHHIYLSSSYIQQPRLDMVKTSEFIVPITDTSGLYDGAGKMILTLYYNEDSLAAVGTDEQSTQTMIYPSVLSTNDHLNLWLGSDALVTIQMFDMIGRQISVNSINAIQGINQLPRMSLTPGMYETVVRDNLLGVVRCSQKIIVR
ncbi:MAG TPA: T9SS type A sorting domain-containing protein [Candidatus Kapabacteria bacterium]|nr:T9SS type A sorting domain-containing protein [Candidatus Kapabacteria bacterium]